MSALESALDLAARGLRVIPLNGKRPLVSDWPRAAATDPETVRRWWEDHPGANVGWVHGPTVAIDVDGPSGEAVLQALESELGPLPETVEVQTGRGEGYRHLVFRAPAGAEIGCRPLAPKLDVRGTGGQTVAPPSIHPDTGEPYTWIRTPDEIEIAELPAAWAERMRAPARSAPRGSTSPGGTIREGSRHAELLKRAGALRRVGAGEAEILAALRAAPCQPPLPEQEIQALAHDVTARYEPEQPPEETWTPYPVEVLPESIRDLALEGAAAIGCDPAYIALPALVVCAGAIGLSRDVRIKRKWREPSVLWGAIVAESGSGKSPGLDLAADPLRELEAAARRANERALADWSERCEIAKAKANKNEKPELPERPPLRRYVVQDATIEALAHVLAATPRGVAVVRDELRTWFASWSEYKGGAGGDSAKWLELHGARALAVDRVLAGGSLYVPRAAVSVVGGIQPGILRRVLGGEHVESGCAARILYAMPPRAARRWSDEEIGMATEQRYAAVVGALAALEPVTVHHADGGSSLAPEGLTLTREALALFAAWVDELGADAVPYRGAEAAAAPKLEGGAARISLVVALVVAAEEGRAAGLTDIDGEAMRAGVEIARWHWREARRVYRALGIATGPAPAAETPEARERRELLALARERGGRLTVRDLRDARSRYRPEGAAEAALRALAEVGHGQVTVGPRGGIRWAAGTGPAGPGPVTDPSDAESAGCGTGTVGPGPGAPGAMPGSSDAEELVL